MRADEVAEGVFREAVIDRLGPPRWLIVTRQAGQVKGWLNICPHAGRALNWAPDQFLTDENGNLVCAAHGAVFEAGTGACVSGPCRGAALTKVGLIEQDGRILLAEAVE